jgi:hypothetical protein
LFIPRDEKNVPDRVRVVGKMHRIIIFSGFLLQPFLPSARSLQVAGDPGGFHDPYPAPAPVAGYEDCDVGEAQPFSADGVRDGDGGDPRDDVCPPPRVDPCQGLPVIRYGTGDHGV